MDRRNGCTNKKYQICTIQGIYRSSRLLKLQKRPNFGQNGGKKKIVNFKANFQLEHCKFINGLENGCANETLPNINIISHK